ncbi:MAG: radical SAM protein [Desulfobacteraceae bacterium]|nr:radical SAM protein [Desulfobacteraceae bacterium]
MISSARELADNKTGYGFLDDKVKEFPRMVIAGISFACNAKCVHCVYAKFDETKQKTGSGKIFMDEDVFQQIALECSQYPWALLRLVGFGEPLLHPKFLSMVRYAKQVGCNIGVITNGSLLDARMAEDLLEAEIDAIDISVDAFSKEVYEHIRKGLNFDTLIENVRMLYELRNKMKKKTFILCSIVEQREVMPELEQAIEFWKSFSDKVVSRKFLTFGLLNTDQKREPYYTERMPCFLLYDRINVDVSGYIRLCGYDSFGKTNLGLVGETNIHQAWHNTELNRIRTCHETGRYNQVGICADCQDWPFHSWQKNYMLDALDNRMEDKQ